MSLNFTKPYFNVSKPFEVNIGAVFFSSLLFLCCSCVSFNACWMSFVGGYLRFSNYRRKQEQIFGSTKLNESVLNVQNDVYRL